MWRKVSRNVITLLWFQAFYSKATLDDDHDDNITMARDGTEHIDKYGDVMQTDVIFLIVAFRDGLNCQ